MTSEASQLVAALLAEETPQDFLKRRSADIAKAGQVEDFEVQQRGIDNSQYFTGCGTAYTEWTVAITGAGDNPHEALEDALEQAAMSGWNVDKIVNDLPTTPSVAELAEPEPAEDEDGNPIEGGDPDPGDCDLYYYVCLRLKGKMPKWEGLSEAESAEEFIKRKLGNRTEERNTRYIRRRPAAEDPLFVPYNQYDFISPTGALHSNGDRQVITTDGQIHQGRNAPGVRDQPVQEGTYQKELDWIYRVRGKHEKIKAIERLKKQLEKVDEPDKKKKRMNLR